MKRERIISLLSCILVLLSVQLTSAQNVKANRVHAVTDLSHEFSFYADHRFHQQYLKGHKGVTNWCDLYHMDFSNANLLILLSCDDRIDYTPEDLKVINDFLNDGGGVVVFGSEKTRAQNTLLKKFGTQFSKPATLPFKAEERFSNAEIEAANGAVLDFNEAESWQVIVSDSENKPVMAKTKVGAGTLLVASRSLAGSHPSARDSINAELWKTILPEIANGKKVNANQPFKGCGIENLEYTEDMGSFVLTYNDYMKPYAGAMEEVYKRTFPFIETRMGVPLSPGMASKITLLATGGGGFSSGAVIALAVWWGGFPERDDSMIEFLTHESVHSWVLPFAEVWNEPIATYVGNLVMMDMGYREEAEKRISKTIERALKYDADMTNYDLQGNLTGEGAELEKGARNDIYWGKSYWILEQLRKENPTLLADYFKLKRTFAKPENISSYGMNETVTLLSMAMKKDMFTWFNQHGIKVNKSDSLIKEDLNQK
ncbi:hypothetical protein [Maribellus sediminis]|uniref:hypothetical protein n=1 Tax=Maribellus sediminis TaxID=2696285 RepID=UPI00142FCDE0|nr:hypothetical protein [Maribellus sediminis]